MITIGVISDIHGDTKKTRKLYAQVRKHKPDAILIPGDIGEGVDELMSVLNIFAKSKVPVYVMPGSHESVNDYKKTIRNLRGTAIVDVMKRKRIRVGDLDLAFIAGSDWLSCPDGFRTVRDKRSNRRQEAGAGISFQYLIDLKKKVRNPDNTLVIVHFPPHTQVKNSIDIAHFGKVTDTAMIVGEEFAILPKGAILPLEQAKAFKKLGAPIDIRKEHVGNKDLRKLLDSLSVKFFLCGHIHEAGRRAITTSEKRVRQGSWSSSLWYNVGCAAQGYAGIMQFEDGKMRFKQLRL
jgi:Icc-related predicted phosphoesterase